MKGIFFLILVYVVSVSSAGRLFDEYDELDDNLQGLDILIKDLRKFEDKNVIEDPKEDFGVNMNGKFNYKGEGGVEPLMPETKSIDQEHFENIEESADKGEGTYIKPLVLYKVNNENSFTTLADKNKDSVK